MTNPKVTVLMSVYDGEKYLREAIESILNQTFKDFEFLIINDGSTDSSRDIILSYNDPRIRLVDNEKNIGLTRSLNKGLRLAKGEYIARMDADDVSLPERLKKEGKLLGDHKDTGLVGSSVFLMNEDGKILGTKKVSTKNSEIKQNLLKGNPFWHGSVMFRRECIEEVGGYREVFEAAQDYDLWLRISEKYNMANIEEPLYKWRIGLRSISLLCKPDQDEYASLAVELAKERNKYGKDRFQILKKEEIDRILNRKSVGTLLEKNLASGYRYWGSVLYARSDYKGALNLLSKSFAKNPWDSHVLVLILKAWVCLILPSGLVRMLKFTKHQLNFLFGFVSGGMF